MSTVPPTSRWKLGFLAVLALGSLAGACLVKPIPQDPAYHRLADTRTLLGIPNFLNVVTNLPFLAAGLYGIRNVLRTKRDAWVTPEVRFPWLVLTGSLFLTGIGSPYYHWATTDATLFWDRLPMAIGFSSLLGILVIEHVDVRLGRRLWGPLVLAAIGSLIFWRMGGDLRFYGLLQGWAIVFLPLILILFPGRTTGDRTWFLVLGFYALAKLFEIGDERIYRFGEIVSGHSLKHLSAGVAAFLIARHVGMRTRMNSSDGTAAGSA